jgi:hypothetical protein
LDETVSPPPTKVNAEGRANPKGKSSPDPDLKPEEPTRFGPCHMFKMNYDVIVKYSDQVAEVRSGSPTGLEDDQTGEEPWLCHPLPGG